MVQKVCVRRSQLNSVFVSLLVKLVYLFLIVSETFGYLWYLEEKIPKLSAPVLMESFLSRCVHLW